MDNIKTAVESPDQPEALVAPMHTFEAFRIIEKLSKGINPLSDEPLTPKSLCLNDDIQRALQVAISALQARIKWIERQAKLPANAGKPWEIEEEESLNTGFDNGDSVDTLAERHQRTKGCITSRLIKMGKISA
ncbi:hypothetical protein [Psychrobacter sanguinis]|uniref:hypothetical protein n=1 Tax=Psychrobacter sanguinis TaxID=861445 RepID=UPI0028AF141E|nr:hypothetical protein [Psychrobacter sanguinis]